MLKNINKLLYISIFAILFFLLGVNNVFAAAVKNGDFKEFTYNGNIETYEVLETGYYKLETWGASGGGTEGGYGSYSRGTVFLKKGTILYIVVGGQGGRNAGGYNGGGAGQYRAGGVYPAGYGGGGATHIATETGLLSTLSNEITAYDEARGTSDSDTILIVSGGGGGRAEDAHWGGHAGGYIGKSNTGDAWITTGGSQAGPGTNVDPGYTTAPSFGKGGIGPSGSSSSGTYGAGGGGAGFYGGGAGSYTSGKNRNSSGAGGSGYIGSSLLTDKVMYCYSCAESNAEHTKTISNNLVSTEPISEYSKIGNGYAKITVLQVSDTNSKLDRIEIDKGSFLETFNPEVYSYNVIVGSEDYIINVKGIPQKTTTTVIGNDNYELKVGNNVINLTVTAESGDISIYTLNVTRTPSSYPYLSDIKVDGESISSFTPSKLEYNVTVEHDVENLNLEAILGRPSQTLYLPSDLSLHSGNNRVEITVVAEDGVNSSIYVLNVFRKHSSYLKDLVLESYPIEFDSKTLTYTIDLRAATMSINVAATPYDEEAIVTTKGFGYIKTSGTATITVTEPNVGSTVYKVVMIKDEAMEPETYDFAYTGDVQVFEAPTSGYYKLEAWGAQGGYGLANGKANGRGGFGAYSTGVVRLAKGDLLYIAVGETGKNGVVRVNVGPSYNGGGGASWDGKDDESAGGGGGATHIAINHNLGELKQYSHNKNDILIVAGGGGGGNYREYGGSGGGITGMPGQSSSGTGGTQTSGYAFGLGQTGVGAGFSNGVSGGGGGWYGGLMDAYPGTDRNAGGGGSGYIGNSRLISYRDNIKVMYGYNVTTSYNASTYTVSTTKYSSIPTSYYAKSGSGYARITLLPQPSENAFLLNLSVKVEGEEQTYTPEFDVETKDYYINLTDSTKTKGELIARPEDSKSTVDGIGEIEIKAGENIHEINITAEAGNVETYRVHITRPADDNPYPNNIVISGLVPSLCEKDENYCQYTTTTFNKDTDTYEITVPYRVKQLWFDVVKGHPYQEVIGDGKISLNPDLNEITIVVTSEAGSIDGSGQPNSVYHFKITRDMTGNTDLSNLSILDPEKPDSEKPLIEYDPDILEYYIAVPNSYEDYVLLEEEKKDETLTNTLQIFAKPDDSEANLTISGPDKLSTGLNKLTITVTSRTGEVTNYIINVYREKNTNVYLTEIKVTDEAETTEYAMIPVFNKLNTGVYNVTVANEIEKVKITGKAEAPTTKVIGNGVKTLQTGVNTYTIVTTSENGETETYVLKITRAKNSDTTLSEIIVKENGVALTLDPVYSGDIFEYETEVSEGTESVEFVITPEVSTTTWKILDGTNIRVGVNKKRIMAIAEDGTSKIYTISITRPASSNNYLSDIELSDGELDPNNNPFDKTVQNYTIVVENSVKNITVKGIKENELSTVKGNGKYSLSVGNNSIIITVISEDGQTRDYTLTVIRKPNSNAFLSNITTSEGVIVTNHEQTSYEINIGADVKSIKVTGIPEEKTTKVNPTSNVITTPTYGDYTEKITTLAEDGVTSIEYTLTIKKAKSSNAKIASLIMEEGAIKPKFNPNEENYTVKVARSVESGTFHVELEDPRSTYEISGNENFEIGENEVKITITAEDGTKKEYKVIVTRQELTSNYLLDIDVIGLITKTDYELGFSKENQYYEVKVPYEETKVSVTAKKEDEDAEISGDGVYSLEVGTNLIVLEVTSLDGKTRSYQIKVDREKSPESRLSNLVIKGSILTPSFNKDIYEYKIETTSKELEFSKIVPMEATATYEIIGNENLDIGEHTVIIRVTAPDKVHTSDYIIKTTRKASDNNNLSDLYVDGYTIKPKFSKTTTVYELKVGNEVANVNIVAVPEDEKASVSGDGIHELVVGENRAIVEVTSESGKVKSYVIIITKEGNDDADLLDIKVKNGIMSPGFTSGNTNYSVVVPYEEESLDLEIKISDDNASYIVVDNNLKVGEDNKVKVIVTAENGSTKTYTLNVTRKEILSALLKELKVKNYVLTPKFDSNITEYDLSVNNEAENITLAIEPLDKNASYKISGDTTEYTGVQTIEKKVTASETVEQRIEINVTASDGVTKETYVINVIKKPYANTFLDYLYTSEGDLDPVYKSTIMEYTKTVGNEVEKIELIGEASDANATVTGLGEYSLKTGKNEFEIEVTSQGVKRIYYVTVIREKSSDNYLLSLEAKIAATKYEITPEFNKDNKGVYVINVPIGTEAINLTGTISDGASVSGLGMTSLHVGTNNIAITVTAEDGSARVYNVEVVREASDKEHLIGIFPSSGNLEPDFTYERTDYTINLDSSVAFLSFEVITEDDNATVSGLESKIVPDGVSTRIIKVIAENGDERIYTITINKERTDNALLADLKVVGYPFEEPLDLDNNFEYHITVPNSKKVLLPSEVVAVAKDPNAKISKSNNVTLTTGNDNEFIVTVTAPDGFTVQEYKIIITREASNEALINSLKVNVGHLTSAFNPNVEEYTWVIPKNTVLTADSVTATSSDPSATIIKTEKLEYVEGAENIYEVMVISEDGKESKTYKLKVELDLSSDATLKDLTIDKGYYEPTFKPNNHRYDAYVYEDEEIVNISATPTVETSKITSGTGEVKLTEEETTHIITVTAEDGLTENYEVVIHKTIKTDKNILDLYLNGLDELREEYCIDDKCLMSPAFDPDVIEYKIKVPYEYEDLSVYVEYANNQQSHKVSVDGKYVETYKLPVGKTNVEVEIYDGLKNKTQVYKIEVERCKSSNNYLKHLSVEGYEIEPVFNKKVLEYTIKVKNDIKEVEIKAEPEDSKAKVYINGYNYLGEGRNDATIEVVAVDGSKRTYIVHIIKEAKYNSLLANITISTGIFHNLAPKFNENTFEYTVTLTSTNGKATIEAVPVMPSTVVSGTGEYELKVGVNEIILTGTAKDEDGNDAGTSTYVLKVIREESTNVDIESLIVEEGTLQPKFTSGNTKYEVNVGYDVEKLTLHVKLADKTSSYIVTGNEHLISGDNIVSIMVMNSTKTKSKTYQITVHKAYDPRNTLKDLKVKDVDGSNEYKITPTFDGENQNINRYSVVVPENVDKVKLEATPSSDKATVMGDGQTYLDFGNNEKTITVTSEDGRVFIYYIDIYREYNMNLSMLVSDKGDLDPEFDPSKTEYRIELDKDVEEITLIAKTQSNKVTVSGTGTYDLEPGENIIEFIVKDPNGHEKKTTVTVVRSYDDNNYIKDLQVNGFISPTFEKTTQEYVVNVREDVDALDFITLELESKTAKYEIKNNNLSGLNTENKVTIEVKSESGKVREYVLTVIRRTDDYFSNKLLSITLSDGKLSPDFDKYINNYAATVANSVSEITIETVKEDEWATVEGDGRVSLELGRNEINIKVTNKLGETNTYSLVIYRTETSDATLKSLTVKGYNYTPIFNKLETEYKLEVSDVDSLDITAVPTDPKSNVKISGDKLLNTGENKVTIEVTAPDGITKKTYTITVVKTASKNNYLSELKINDYEFDKQYKKEDQGPYTVNVGYDVENVMVIAVPEVSTSKVSGDGIRNLVSGKNTIQVEVTSEEGTVRTYTIVVNKAASTDSTLKDILVSDGELDPTFNAGILKYEVVVPGELDRITITGVLNDTRASISGNGTYELKDKETEVKLVVTAEDGNKTTYIVNIKKDITSSSKLRKLVVKDGELYPRFHMLIDSYTILVPNEVTSLNMEYIPVDENASVVVSGNESFKVGSNKVKIKVTSSDGSSETEYVINVVRQAMASNYLSSLSVEGYILNPIFEKEVLYYEVRVPMEVESVKIKATAEDPTSTVSGTGLKSVEPGENRFYVTVESSSGVIRSYQILVIKEESSENKLLTLTYDVGSISPEFDPDKNEYTITVPEKTKEITLDGTISENSSVVGLGKSNVEVGSQTRIIAVTSQSGEVSNYTIHIERIASTNTRLTKLVPSKGELEYSNEITEYEIEVADDVNVISFETEPEDSDAKVEKEELVKLEYGINKVIITVIAEDGITKRDITIKVKRIKELIKIIASEENILLSVDEEKVITYDLDPIDPTYPEIEWKSLDEEIAEVDQNGRIVGKKLGVTTVQIISTYNNSIYATINVQVVNKRIVSSVYEIKRKSDESEEEIEEHVIGLESRENLSYFINNFDNNPSTLHVYGSDGLEITDEDEIIGTFMIIKLEIEGTVYDTLTIVVRGDLNGDGYINVSDSDKLKNKIATKIEFNYIERQAGDLNQDGYINVTDSDRLKNFLAKKLTSLN